MFNEHSKFFGGRPVQMAAKTKVTGRLDSDLDTCLLKGRGLKKQTAFGEKKNQFFNYF